MDIDNKWGIETVPLFTTIKVEKLCEEWYNINIEIYECWRLKFDKYDTLYINIIQYSCI